MASPTDLNTLERELDQLKKSLKPWVMGPQLTYLDFIVYTIAIILAQKNLNIQVPLFSKFIRTV